MPVTEFEAKWSDLALWNIPLGIDRLSVSYAPAGRSDLQLPGNACDPFDESQPARVAGKAFMNLANGWARSDPARVAGGFIQGAGAAAGFALLFPGQALQVLGGPAGDLGTLLAGSGAIAAWGSSLLGDAFRTFEVAPD